MSEKLREAARDAIRSAHYFNGTRPDVDMLAHLKALGKLLDSSARLEAALAEPETCVWEERIFHDSLTDDPNEMWACDCGCPELSIPVMDAVGYDAKHGHFVYCPGCGKRIEVKE